MLLFSGSGSLHIRRRDVLQSMASTSALQEAICNSILPKSDRNCHRVILLHSGDELVKGANGTTKIVRTAVFAIAALNVGAQDARFDSELTSKIASCVSRDNGMCANESW